MTCKHISDLERSLRDVGERILRESEMPNETAGAFLMLADELAKPKADAGTSSKWNVDFK